MVGILILNWNGWRDTVDCLKSLFKMDCKDFFVVIGDNGSTDGSIDSIIRYCHQENIIVKKEIYGSENVESLSSGDVIIYDLKTNNGFAKGNNILIQYSKYFSPEYYLLLNNDTEVTSDFLSSLLLFKGKHQGFDVVSPLIMYYYDKNIVWNAGGKLFWGFRQYYYQNKSRNEIKEKDYISCSFLTGCCILFNDKILSDDKLFTEQFFFGEEDFNLALRLKKQKIKQACALESVIFHKVSSSTKTVVEKQKIYIYYLNRYIDLRHNMSRLSYLIWKIVNGFYFHKLMSAKGYTKEIRQSLLKRIESESVLLEGVSKDYFIHAMKDN